MAGVSVSLSTNSIPATLDTNVALGNRVAIVTGASSGIGKAIAVNLAENGCAVVLAARRIELLESLSQELQSKGLKVLACRTDVTSVSEVSDMVKKVEDTFGQVDILVNAAGLMYFQEIKNVCVEEWHKMVEVNCKGVLNTIYAVLPGMRGRGSGHIINISSDAGRKVYVGLTVYSATKFFVEALSQGLRLEMADAGVKVTTIQPGDVKTPLFDLSTDKEAVEKYAQSNEDMFLQPEDIAKAVLFAVSQGEHCAVNEILIEHRQGPL